MNNPLGQTTTYPSSYDAGLLFPIPRKHSRAELGISDPLPFRGYDAWRAYELSWLNNLGKPVVAVGEFLFPVTSENLVESKSLKLYLNSLNQERFESLEAVEAVIARDLGAAAQCRIIVKLWRLQEAESTLATPDGCCLDSLDIAPETYTPAPQLLTTDQRQQVAETLYSDLFRSNCPVTSQPDWGTVVIRYDGQGIDHASLLRYLVSFRNHEGFHEECAERIFRDLQAQCAPRSLSVAINFLRRGGLEINPVRSTIPQEVEFPADRYQRQ